MGPIHKSQNNMKQILPVVSFFIFHFSFYFSAFCEVDQCPLRQGLTPPELKPFSSLTGLQAASRGAGQCLRQGNLH